MYNISKQFITALVFTSAISISSAAHAQKGSRVCGPFHAGLGMAIILEGGWTGKSRNQRNAIDDACRDFTKKVLTNDFLSQTGTQKDDWVFLKRVECEGAASSISSGASNADICDLMSREKPYKVMYRNGGFTAERLD